MSESKLLKGIIIGAAVGGLVTMFDKKTREHTIQTFTKAKDTIVYYSKNSDELKELISNQIENVQELYSKTTNNINSIVGTIEDVKGLPESVQSFITNTKKVISPNNSSEG